MDGGLLPEVGGRWLLEVDGGWLPEAGDRRLLSTGGGWLPEAGSGWLPAADGGRLLATGGSWLPAAGGSQQRTAGGSQRWKAGGSQRWEVGGSQGWTAGGSQRREAGVSGSIRGFKGISKGFRKLLGLRCLEYFCLINFFQSFNIKYSLKQFLPKGLSSCFLSQTFNFLHFNDFQQFSILSFAQSSKW